MSVGRASTVPVFVFSPHPDDAAFSVGGLLCGGVFGDRVRGVSVFTRSPAMTYGDPFLSRTIGKPLGSLPFQQSIKRPRLRLRVFEVSRMRKKEDKRYFNAISAQRIDFDLRDAPLRGYWRSPWVSNLAVVRKDPVFGVVAGRVESLVASGGEKPSSTPARGRCVLVIPLGLGGHVDHLIVREGCSDAGPDTVRIYYEDLPYAEGLTGEEVEEAARSVDRELEPHLFNIGETLEKKIGNLRLYKTVVGDKEVERVLRYARKVGGKFGPCERLWYGILPEDSEVKGSLGQAEQPPA